MTWYEFSGLVKPVVHATPAYELISLTGPTTRWPSLRRYPNEDRVLRGKTGIRLPTRIFDPARILLSDSPGVGPFMLGRTKVRDLYGFQASREEYQTMLHALHPGPGNNAILIRPKRLSACWHAVYLVFGPTKMDHTASSRDYRENDVLLAIDLVLGKEANRFQRDELGDIRYLGQRLFDGALVYQSRVNSAVYFTQLTGPVGSDRVPKLLSHTLTTSKDISLERVIVSDLAWETMDWILGGYGLGVGYFGGVLIDRIRDDCCKKCVVCTEACMEAGKEPDCITTCMDDCTDCKKDLSNAFARDHCAVMYTAPDVLRLRRLSITQHPDPLESLTRIVTAEEAMRRICQTISSKRL